MSRKFPANAIGVLFGIRHYLEPPPEQMGEVSDRISVVTISKIDRSDEPLLRTLGSFSETVPKDRYLEYIVVCAPKVREVRIPADIKNSIKDLRILYTDVANWSIQRNIGVMSARGDFIVFVDDDMRFHNGWFDELVRVMVEKQDAGVVCAVVLPDRSRTAWGACQGALNHPGGGYKLLKEDVYEIEHFHTTTCIARRDLLLVSFDESLRYGCEDMDISVRIKKTFPGIKFYLNPKAVVFHSTRDTVTEIWKWMVRYGKGRVDIYRKHGLKMTGFFIHKLLLFLASSFLLLVFVSPVACIASILAFYLFYLVKLRRYKKFLRNSEFLLAPVTFWMMNLAFDFGRITRFMEIYFSEYSSKKALRTSDHDVSFGSRDSDRKQKGDSL